MKTNKNVFNPENIQIGDHVRQRDDNDRPTGPTMLVKHVGGSNANKVFCDEIGHELYATCFKLVRKGGNAKV